MKLFSIFVYPVKSLGGVELDTVSVLKSGLDRDRCFLIVDETGSFITQRENPRLAKIGCTIEDSQIILFELSRPANHIRLDDNEITQNRIQVSVWKHKFESNLIHTEISNWISSIIQQPCRLTKMDATPNRNKTFTVPPHTTPLSYADGYPFLLTSNSSLDELNARMESIVAMDRFRSNLVTGNIKAFEEENWKDFRIGTALFRMVKRCIRCTVITTDQSTGERNEKVFETLASFRKFGRNVCFGMNAICLEEGIISKGDDIELI